MSTAKWRDILQRFSGRGVYPHEMAFLLETPLRNLILSPQELADRLHLTNNAHVLEIGPGPGFFSVEVGRRSPAGYLVLFDIQREMLEKSRSKLERAGVRRYAPVQGSAVDLPFRPGAFDIAFLVTVLGEVPDPRACLACIHRALCPGGYLSVSEPSGDPDALTSSELRSLAETSGFQFVEQLPFPTGYTLNLSKAPDSEATTG